MNAPFAMLPYYLLGNVHCLGMCGPIAALLGRHPYRLLYFVGRCLSFTLAALLAGSFGEVLGELLARANLAAYLSIFFGLSMAFFALFGKKMRGIKLPFLSQQQMTALILKETPLATFLFGFFTVFLPCGQTLVVFSYCALLGDATLALLNGLAFALLTSPSLFLAMQSQKLLRGRGEIVEMAGQFLALAVALLALLRGFAELSLIPHFPLIKSAHLFLW